MKRIKKLASLLLAMVMVLSMGLTVSATGATAPTDNTEVGNTKAGNGDFTITINDSTEGYTYQAYQIFTGDLSKAEDGTKTLSNIEWGSGVDVSKVNKLDAFQKEVDGQKVPMTAAEVAERLAGNATTNAFDTSEAKDFAALIETCKSTTVSGESTWVAKTDKVEAHYEIGSLTAGYYLVLNSAVPTVDGAANGDFTRYMMEVVGDVTATPKRGTLEHDKDIVIPNGTEGVDYVKANEAPIGEAVNYRIPVTLPQNFADYQTYYLEFSDTLTKGLTFNRNSVKVMVGEGENAVDITKYFYVGTEAITTGDFAGGVTITVNISDIKGLNNIDGITVNATTPIILTYNATLNENAVIGIAGNPNFVKVVHSNDPNNSGDGPTTPPENPDKPTPTHPTGVTPDKEVITYTTELAILKTNEAKQVLPGTEFTLSGEGVLISYITAENFVEDASGAYWKLKNGSYTLTAPVTAEDETNNEADYASTTQKYRLERTITPKEEAASSVKASVQDDGRVVFTGLGQGKYKLEETVTLAGYNTIDPIEFEIFFTGREFFTDNDLIGIGVDNTLQMDIVNQSGSLLPSTGGIGTTIFYVVGGILVVAAGILLVTKKRMSAR